MNINYDLAQWDLVNWIRRGSRKMNEAQLINNLNEINQMRTILETQLSKKRGVDYVS